MEELLLEEVKKLTEISESAEALAEVIEREKEKKEFINNLDMKLADILEV